MRLTIERWDIPPGRRILVSSDIHGHLALLKQLLKKAEYTEDDILILVGDLVEKGPDSLGTLRYVMDLCKRHTVQVLAGNVDLWRVQMVESLTDGTAQDFYSYLLKMRQWKGTSLYDEMARELGRPLESPQDVLEAKEDIMQAFHAELEFLRTRPSILETERYIFVHGGLPTTDLESLRGRDAFEVLKVDRFMPAGLQFDKYVVVGHWPVVLYGRQIAQSNPIIDKRERIISIDGGCGIKTDGQLNMLIIPEGGCEDPDKLSYLYCDGFPVYEAASAQEESRTSINIRWGDNEVRLLSRGEESTYVEHVSSGYRLWIDNEHLREERGNVVCEDYTDYRLAVQPGDKLSLVQKTEKGCLVKKGGVTGWYHGQLRLLPGADHGSLTSGRIGSWGGTVRSGH